MPSFLRGAHDLADEALGPPDAAVAVSDAARSNEKVVVMCGHCSMNSEKTREMARGGAGSLICAARAPAGGTGQTSKMCNLPNHLRPTRVGAFYLAVPWLGPPPPAATPPTLRQTTPACKRTSAHSSGAALLRDGSE